MSKITFKKVQHDPRLEGGELASSWASSNSMQAWIHAPQSMILALHVVMHKPWNPDHWEQVLSQWLDMHTYLRASFSPSGKTLCLHKSIAKVWRDIPAHGDSLEKILSSFQRDPNKGPLWELWLDRSSTSRFDVIWVCDRRLLNPQQMLCAWSDLYSLIHEVKAPNLQGRLNLSRLHEVQAHLPLDLESQRIKRTNQAWPDGILPHKNPDPKLLSHLNQLSHKERESFWLTALAGFQYLFLSGFCQDSLLNSHEATRSLPMTWDAEHVPSFHAILQGLLRTPHHPITNIRDVFSSLTILPMLDQHSWLALPCEGFVHLYADPQSGEHLLAMNRELLSPLQQSLCDTLWVEWLEQIILHPNTSLSNLHFSKSTQQLKEGFYGKSFGSDIERTIPSLLEPSFEANKSRIAVKTAISSLSYEDLDLAAKAFAFHLHSLGLGAGDLIGVATPRDPSMLVVLLGILRAGAAYVPLDPQFPEERLRFMIEDSKLRACIGIDEIRSYLPPETHFIAMRDIEIVLEKTSPGPWIPPSLSPDQAAYVIYTSGSTGKPKGVVLRHRSVVNFLMSMKESPGMASGDRLLAVTTLSFDIAVLELYLPLLAGASLYLASPDDTKDGKRLYAILQDEGITHFQATPSTYRLLIDSGWQGSTLQKALCGGEAFPADIARKLSALGLEIWNMYGPTETTVWSAIHRLTANDQKIPIGRPIHGTSVFILDDNLQICLPGQKGEIYIGGVGLALGYLERPELTAERFLHAPGPDALVYKTGDIGCYRWDGLLEIFGRADHQIKLRGYRMELGEIEAVVAQAPTIQQCIAAVKEYGPNDQRLVAYVTLLGAWDERALRHFLKDRLPAYMLPQQYVVIPMFPLLPNGKIDRKALPHPQENSRAEALPIKNFHFETSKRSHSHHHLTTKTTLLTPSQSRMLYVEELEPGTTVHNLSAAWVLRGPLQIAKFRQALELLLEQQEALRSSISFRADQAILHVHSAESISLPLSVSEQKRTLSEALSHIRMITEDKLDIRQAPNFKINILHLDDGTWIFHLLNHHIFWDGFSYSVFWQKLTEHYNHLVMQTGSLPYRPQPPSYNYSHYAFDLQQELVEPEMLEELEFWKSQFLSIPEPLELSYDFPRPKELNHRAGTVWINWNADTDRLLVEFSKKHSCSVFHVLLSTYFVLLHRLSNQEDLVIGTPVHGRRKADVFGLLGNFINVIALRVRCEEQLSFQSLLSEVKRVSNDGLAHVDLPFEQVISELKLPRDLSRTPLYTTMLFYQDLSKQSINLHDLSTIPLRLNNLTVDTDLVLSIERHSKETFAALHFRSDLWEKETAQSMADAYRSLLDDLLHDPDQSIGSVPLISFQRREYLLAMGRCQLNHPSPAHTLEAWLSQQASALGPELAVTNVKGETLSYKAFDEKTLTFAHFLYQQGIRRGDIVGVCLERSPELMIVLRGILRLGAAYLPLDPLYPAERLQYMIQDAQTKLIVSQLDHMDLFNESETKAICLEKERSTIQKLGPIPREIPGPEPEDLAYVIYTSGSTGKPKGVEIQHRAVVHFLQAFQQRVPPPKQLKTLAITTISFDISVLELFGTLCWGGEIVLLTQQEASDGSILREAFEKYGINLFQATPASWRLLLASGWQGKKELIALCGGEALSRDLTRQLVPKVKALWNVYGPTEATVWATVDHVHDPDAPICIGRVLPGYEALVLDKHLQIVPQGTIGQLFLSGPALARGYRFRPELSAEKFRQHILYPSMKMYETGDLVRMRADGRLEYISRADNQIKLRGYRIELGEIESCMTHLPSIKQAVCMVKEIGPGDHRLVAYATLQQGQNLDLARLHRHLGNYLPSYMLPNHLLVMPELPLTANGKIDKKALPAPSMVRPSERGTGDTEKTMDETTKRLAQIFADLLGIPSVRGSDNFFDLGGHSLLALRVLSRSQDELGLSIKIRDLLLMTVQQLAQLKKAASNEEGGRHGT